MRMKRARWIALFMVLTLCISLLAPPVLSATDSEEEEHTEEGSLMEVETEVPLVNVLEPEAREEKSENLLEPEDAEALSAEELAEESAATEGVEEANIPEEANGDELTEKPETEGAVAEEPAEDGAAEQYVVSYYVGSALLSQETVTSGKSPSHVPTTDGSGNQITAWQDSSGAYVDVAAEEIEKNVSYYVWFMPMLETSSHIRYMNGTGAAQFSPSASLTRAQAATILYNLLTTTEKGPYTYSFSDVSSSAWYADAVQTLASYGVLSGYDDGTFRPNSSVTRAEFVTMVVRLYGVDESAKAGFSDTSGNWAEEYIATAVNKGWITGYEDNTFRPSQTITRAEATVIMNRVLGRTPDESQIEAIIDGGAIVYLDVSTDAWYYDDVMEASVRHTYIKSGSSETWTSYTVSNNGLAVGINNVGGKFYYVSPSTGKLVDLEKGINKLDGGFYYAKEAGNVIYADLTSKAGYALYADGSQKKLSTGFNLIGGSDGDYFYWTGSTILSLSTTKLNKIDGNYYLANADGFTIRRGFGAGVVNIDGKLYISDGACAIVSTGKAGSCDTSTTTASTVVDLANHTYEYNGAMYYVTSDYSLAVDTWEGYLYFGADGKYTTGDATLDAYVDNIVSAYVSNNSLTQEEKLLQAYYYLRGGYGSTVGSSDYTYYNTGEVYSIARYNGQKQYSWMISCATRMFRDKHERCYGWAAAYLYLARRLGYQSYIVVDQIWSSRHCFCLIQWDGKWHISDVEIEWGYINSYYTGVSTYMNLFAQTLSSESVTYYKNPSYSVYYYLPSL